MLSSSSTVAIDNSLLSHVLSWRISLMLELKKADTMQGLLRTRVLLG